MRDAVALGVHEADVTFLGLEIIWNRDQPRRQVVPFRVLRAEHLVAKDECLGVWRIECQSQTSKTIQLRRKGARRRRIALDIRSRRLCQLNVALSDRQTP